MSVHHRACHLCEAICGLDVEHEAGRVVGIRGDPDDPFSRGHVCPKAVALADLHLDGDRLKRPIRRRGADWEEIGWEEALDDAAARIRAVQKKYGRDAVGFYVGNPAAHNLGSTLGAIALSGALRTRARFSSNSIDALPRLFVSWLLFGNQAIIPIPDVDRTAYLLVIGANPVVSNGSVMTAPGIAKRIAAIRARGGKVVVFDPRRTETAEIADEHHFVRPGRDAALLLALLHVVFEEGRARPGRNGDLYRELERVRAIAARFSPERVASVVGVEASVIRRIARELAGASSAVVYGRLGLCNQAFGALSTWATDLLNVATGNMDRVGGAMFTTPAVDLTSLAKLVGQAGSLAKEGSRARGLPAFNGELPVAAMAEEIEGEGKGRVRALVTSCGNPVLSTPNGPRLARALEGLEAMISMDIYLNETTRHAHVILPPTFGLENENYDLVLHAVAVRNTVRWTERLFDAGPDARDDWSLHVGLVERLGGSMERVFGKLLARALTPARIIDTLLRLGPYGDKFIPWSKGLDLAKVKASPHGIDLGPLQEGRLDALVDAVDLAPARLVDDVARLEKELDSFAAEDASGRLSLIGRRELRSNNSWMHNSTRLVKGRPRCTMRIHPRDAAARGLVDGAKARVTSRVGSIEVVVEVTDELMPGVVSIPHGWGHDRKGSKMAVAEAHAGVSANDLTDESLVDPVSGNAAVNGVPVDVVRVASTIVDMERPL